MVSFEGRASQAELPKLDLRRLVNRFPDSCDYWPLVSTITGIFKSIFFSGIFVLGSLMFSVGLLGFAPGYLVGKTIDLVRRDLCQGQCGRKAAKCFLDTALYGFSYMAVTPFSIFRAAISIIPLLGNGVLLVSDEVEEQQRKAL